MPLSTAQRTILVISFWSGGLFPGKAANCIVPRHTREADSVGLKLMFSILWGGGLYEMASAFRGLLFLLRVAETL